MCVSRVLVFFFVAVVGIWCSGCTGNDFKTIMSARMGPDPSLPATEVESASSNQAQVLAYITQDLRKASGQTTIDWFDVAEWGFNIGRQDCDVYLNSLFRLSREKQRNDSVLNAVSGATNTILTSATTGQKALSVAAAAFTMTTAVNDSLFQSFLFSEAPGLLAAKVKEMQDTYRDKVEKNQASGNKITSASSAYHVIQDYYNICLPQSIEGTLLQTVANTTAQTSDPGNPPGKTGGAGGGGAGGAGAGGAGANSANRNNFNVKLR